MATPKCAGGAGTTEPQAVLAGGCSVSGQCLGLAATLAVSITRTTLPPAPRQLPPYPLPPPCQPFFSAKQATYLSFLSIMHHHQHHHHPCVCVSVQGGPEGRPGLLVSCTCLLYGESPVVCRGTLLLSEIPDLPVCVTSGGGGGGCCGGGGRNSSKSKSSSSSSVCVVVHYHLSSSSSSSSSL